EDVPLSNRVEGAGRGKESCRSGEEGSVLQIRALQSVKGQEIGDAERAGDLVDVLPVELELLAEKLSDALRASLVDLEPNRRSETPPPNVLGHRPKKITGLVLSNLNVRVTCDSKGGRAADLHSGKEVRQMRFDEVLQQEKVGGGAAFGWD